MEITPEIQAMIDAAAKREADKVRKEQFDAFEAAKARAADLEAKLNAKAEEEKRARQRAMQSEVKRIALSEGLVNERLLGLPDLQFALDSTEEQIKAGIEAFKASVPEAFKPASAGQVKLSAPSATMPVPPPTAPPAETVPPEMLLAGGLDLRKILREDGSFELEDYARTLMGQGKNWLEIAKAIPGPGKGLLS